MHILKLTLLALFIQSAFCGNTQDPLIEYYNKNWKVVPKDSSFYYGHFVKAGELFQCTTYHVSNQAIKGIGTVKDTSFSKIVGVFKEYNEKGLLEDSFFYSNDHKLETHSRFHDNGKLKFKYTKSSNGKETIEGFDKSGKTIKDFIYVKDAFFKGGEKAWQTYLMKTLNNSIRVKNVQNETQANVIVQFVVGKQGRLIDVTIKESSGYDAVDKDAIRVVRSSPPWEPAILYNEHINVYRLQPITYILTSEKAK